MDSVEFKSAKQIGRAEELKVKQTLEARGFKVFDLTNIPQYQSQDIDFLVQKDEEQALIEVKADRKIGYTRNMCIELISNEQTRAKGWFYYCEADYIFYSDTVENLCYCFLLEDLKRYFKDKRREISDKRIFERTKSRILAFVNMKAFQDYLKQNELYFQILNLGEC